MASSFRLHVKVRVDIERLGPGTKTKHKFKGEAFGQTVSLKFIGLYTHTATIIVYVSAHTHTPHNKKL